MGTAISLRNIIGVTENIFLKTIIPLQSHLNTGAIFPVSAEMHNLINSAFIGVQKFNKGA